MSNIADLVAQSSELLSALVEKVNDLPKKSNILRTFAGMGEPHEGENPACCVCKTD